ncbi:Patatin domain-containing protein [Cephalotus follicularis]|uniref:Patatin n=1 Tax=Cephalotus follicularis TaxID=3775 RepID=A0A1Q3B5N7_CEPFO|nr:Patatin domain-containing protein [Cephalotus follicularis]
MSTGAPKFPLQDSTFGFDTDKLTYEIFSVLENKFLFGYQDQNSLSVSKTHNRHSSTITNGKVRILSIDGGGATDGILAAKSLAHLEDCLRRKSGNPIARIADYFDVVAGSGAGGILVALLFTRGQDGYPLLTAESAVRFLSRHHRRLFQSGGVIRRFFQTGKIGKLMTSTFGECTLKDTLKSVLIPCYDLSSRAPFLFSRADAVEMDGYDFKMREVCLATAAIGGPVEMYSMDRRTKILAVDGRIAMNNPTAAAITHVLNNKQEFPFCNGVEDLLVLSLGNGDSDFGCGNVSSSPSRFIRIAAEGASDMVDQAVSMAFRCLASNYVRIQANGMVMKCDKANDILKVAEDMLGQKYVESVLFKGKKMVESTNFERLDLFGGDLIKEQERRKTTILPTVVLKHAPQSPRSTLSSC